MITTDQKAVKEKAALVEDSGAFPIDSGMWGPDIKTVGRIFTYFGNLQLIGIKNTNVDE